MKIRDLEHQEVFCLSGGEEATSQISGGSISVTADALALGVGEDLAIVLVETQTFAYSFPLG